MKPDVLRKLETYKGVPQAYAFAGRDSAAGEGCSCPGEFRTCASEEASRRAICGSRKHLVPGAHPEDFNPALLAQAYAAGGAAGMSVLTDRPTVSEEPGIPDHRAREVTDRPVLCRDFMFGGLPGR
jgi:indole-3-glycerol phosphate synthase